MFSLDAPLGPAIDAFVNPENDESAQKTALNTVVMQVHRSVSVELLIQTMGAHLTSTDDKTRARATLLLAEVLTRLPELPLASNAVQLLLDFCADRLADFPSANACLQALVALETHHANKIASPLTTIALIQKVTTALHVPQLGQAMRKHCFLLIQLALRQPAVLNTLLASSAAAASSAAEPSEDHGAHFARAFLNAMEGEKDPRNLLLCLQIARELMAAASAVFGRHDALLQQYIDVVSCYFPITFTPPPNDPYGITSEELIMSLRRGFAASDVLAKHVLPFLLKKVSSTAVEAKLDSLQTLVYCAEAYSIQVMLLHLREIADALYHEVVKGEKKDIIEASLAAISRFASLIANATTKSAGGAEYAWNQFVVTLATRATSDLRENASDSLVSVSAGQVLAALGKDSGLAFSHVLENSVSLLLQQLEQSSTSTTSKCEASLAQIRLIVNTIDREIDQSLDSQPMRPHATVLINALVAFLAADGTCSSPYAKQLAIESLCHLVTFPPSPIVEPAQVQALIELFTRFLLSDPSHDVRHECLQSLKAISTIQGTTPDKHYAAYVMQISMTQLMEAVKQDAEHEAVATLLESSSRSHDLLFQDVLNAITELCCEASIFQATIVRLVNLCVHGNDVSASLYASEDSETTFKAHHEIAILEAIAKIVELNAEDKASMEFCVSGGSSMPTIFHLLTAVANTASIAARQNVFIDDSKLNSCTRIFRTVMQSVSVESQQLLANATITSFLETQNAMSGNQSPAAHPAFLQLVPLFSAIINSAKRTVALPQTSHVINCLLELAQASTTTSFATFPPATEAPNKLENLCAEAAVSAAKSLASMINKMSDGEEFDALIHLLLEQKLSQIILQEQEELSVRLAALQIYVWIAKALVIRGHRTHAAVCLRFLCQFITPSRAQDKSPLGMHVAKSFQLLMTEYPDVLNRKCGASITVSLPSGAVFG